MPERITQLTDAQIARFPEWVEKWVGIGLSTEPANFDEAIKGVLGCYSVTKLPAPKIVLRMSSPYGACIGGILGVLMIKSSQVRSQVDSQVRSQVDSQVYSQVHSQAWSQVGSQARSQVESQVRSQVWSQVGQVESQVWSQVGSQVWSQVRSQVESQVYSQVYSQVASQVDWLVRSYWTQYRGGNMWSGWYAYVSFLRDVCEWTNPLLESLAHDERHALNASWCWYHHDVCAISDRPRILRRNALGQLHCDTGPAMRYADGWELWRINGIEVDEQIVMRPETQTITQLNQELNADVRSIRITRFGWPRYLQESGSVCLHSRTNEIEGTREALFTSPFGERRLVVTCPTGRIFALGVPGNIESCEQAQRWLHPSHSTILART